MRVAVIGAGVAGLAAALEVARLRPDAEVVVFEQSPVVGGKLRTGRLAGHPVDVGAEAMLARRPEGLELMAAAGLAGDRIDPLTTSASVWTPDGLRAIPTGTVMGVPGDFDAARRSGLFGADTLARIAHEAQTEHEPLHHDVAVGRLVADRLGPEVVNRLVDPILGGVYAGRPDRLSLRATVPALAAALEAGGSLVGAAARASAGSARGSSSGPARSATISSPADATRAAPVFASVRGGLGRLPGAVVEQASFTVRTSTAVRAIRRTPAGFALAIGARPDGVEIEADAVILATPAVKAATLLRELTPSAAHELETVDSASVAIVSIALALDTATKLPSGSGLLVPPGAASLVKGVTITSQKWPGAPDALALIRASVGRFGDEMALQRDDDELRALVVADLRVLLGADIAPVDSVVTRWGGALPQYDVGHVERVARIRSAVATVPGLAVAGAAYDGVGIPACVASGRLAASAALAATPVAAPGSTRPTTSAGSNGQ